MLGWMIKRGLDGGRDATDGPDDTQIEQPDTPGPVFAARAFKSALFGTPARPDSVDDGRQVAEEKQTAAVPTIGEPQLTSASGAQDAKTARNPKSLRVNNLNDLNDMKDSRATPGRLPGILLTPGTATSRRKRVSFGHDVDQNGGNEKKNEFKIDRSGRRPSLFGDTRSQPRSKLAQALETARSHSGKTGKPAAASEQHDEQKQTKPDVAADGSAKGTEAEDDNLWEEVDDAEWDPDVTVDLNEPHSQSGRYWKSQFQRYQEDAKIEMSKLLKYKQLAKSYAKMKDAEAGDMHAKLREEKDKVVKMEARITELAGQIARKRMKGSDRDYQELISDLTRQTALAVQYRNQVKELEAMLQDNWAGDVPQQQGSDEPVAAGLASRHRHQATITAVTSPRTQRTLVETQRELRRARDQVRELTQAREEVRRLKSALRAAEQRALKGESETKTLVADLASSEAAAVEAAAKVQDLEKRAKFAEDERRRKDDELRLLQRKYDSLKDDAKARVGEAEQVLRRKNELISELKKQTRQSTARQPDEVPAIDYLVDLGTATNNAKVDNKAKPAAASATAPTTLAALEKVTRSRYEILSSKRNRDQQPDLHKHTGGAELDDFATKPGDLQLDHVDEPDLPQQKIHRQRSKQKQQAIHILEDESSRFELPAIKSVPTTAAGRPNLAARTKVSEAKRKEDDEAVEAANLLLLRRRRGAEPLRPIDPQQKNAVESIGVNGGHGGEPKIDLVSGRFARLGEAATKKAVDMDKEHDDPVTAAAAAAADASRLSLSSDRAAAAVARIERRRAERKRELALLRNKENMQPA